MSQAQKSQKMNYANESHWFFCCESKKGDEQNYSHIHTSLLKQADEKSNNMPENSMLIETSLSEDH